MEVTMAMCVFVAFCIVGSFLIGAYSMFRISEHYNRKIREIITRQTERRVEHELFDLDAPQPAAIKPRQAKAKKNDTTEVKANG